MCARYQTDTSFLPLSRKEYANSLRELADLFRNVCPNATFFLRQEAQRWHQLTEYAPPPREPREWSVYEQDGKIWPVHVGIQRGRAFKVREVLE